ncbi:Stage VI sporulation protein D [Paraliobacillus sp. PM-2]|uniref:stage VI sporulation protein D n=1 Tax=Paraliobacillus sp. PM-2 TaxID=1462524 RepID=UPI00061CA111|nr:stage VI sporulation protein D [Paraliobacillus sp. PM-2]CQR48030.1 Stage VI sporulation protein D [Paraliobacillus sp. PM-2]
MSDYNQNVFTFELDESLRLKNGQEVGEMIHISLEPEISIQTFSDHISVRGVMELKGEYYVDPDADLSYVDEVLDIREYPNQRYLDIVERQEESVNYFAHQFPVEISIPSHRVSNLDDVLVGIESFDYEIPEQSQLRLNATIAIHGIDCVDNEERNEELEGDSESVEDKIESDGETSDSNTFRFEVEEPEATTQPEELDEEVGSNETEEIEISNESSQDTPDNDENEKAGRWPTHKSQSFADFFGKKEESPESPESTEEFESSESIESIESVNDIESMESIEINEQPSAESPEVQRTEDETSIVHLFNHGEEESYTKLRMCIVQESDTLEAIAERYDVSTMQLSQTNDLENDDVLAGQILYIPNKRKKK